MNPFIFDPKKITTVSAAQYIIGLYQAEQALLINIRQQLDDALMATVDVITKENPDIQSDLQLISEQATLVGHAEGAAQDNTVMLDEFKRALPYAIRLQLSS